MLFMSVSLMSMFVMFDKSLIMTEHMRDSVRSV